MNIIKTQQKFNENGENLLEKNFSKSQLNVFHNWDSILPVHLKKYKF